MTTFAYGRVGREDHGAEDRRSEIEQAGYQVDYWFADGSNNGDIAALQRPRFKAMLRQMRSEDLLVVLKLDRLGRNAQDIDATIKALVSRNIKLTVLEIGTLNLTSAAGKPVLAMLAALAAMDGTGGMDGMDENSPGQQPQCAVDAGKASRAQRCASRMTPEQRAQIVTDYSLGQSISELARQYRTTRANILDIVTPRSQPEPRLPLVWGE